ncbi:MAG: hypothetical protein PUG15_01180 [Bacteroidales bacterium]|nr:hypothetical protein [Bacteroidales bacterium]
MAQQKGHTGNPNGRPKGTPNKVTATIRQWIVNLINDNREQLEQDFQNLEPKDRLQMLEKLLPYILPKVEQANEVEGAAFTKDDLREKDVWNIEAKEVKQWYE